jgi:anti-sigma factor RsiW
MIERIVGGMRCSEVLALLSEYVDGELDTSAVESIEAHLLGCPNCERFGRNFGSMVVSIRAEGQSSPHLQSEAMSRLLAQLHMARTEP